MAHVRWTAALLSKLWKGRSVQLAAGAALLAMPAYVSAITINVSSTSGSANRAANATALQGEIDAAVLRAGPTTLVLTKGHEFNPIVLKKKTLDDAYIIIESSGYSDGTLPAPGVRVGPGNSANMPKMVGGTGTNGTQAVRTSAGAKHYILRGLEFFKADTNSFYGLVSLGTDAHTLVADIPHHITIDQCYLWAADTQEMFRAINLHSGHTTVSNSYIRGAKSFPTSGDSQAMGAWNGTGPYWVVNNFLEGSTENFLVGGAGHVVEENPSDPNIPSDITFKQNYCPKRLEWLPDPDPVTGNPQWAVSSARNWQVKNSFEIKQGLRYDVQGNYFENSWGQYAGHEFAIVLKVTRNSNSVSQTEALTHDMIFKYNRINHAPGAFMTEGRVYSAQWPPDLRRFTIQHNLFEDITASANATASGWGYTTNAIKGAFWYGAHGSYDIRIQHNTCFNAPVGTYGGSFIDFYSENTPNFYPHVDAVVSNNVVQGNGARMFEGIVNNLTTYTGSAALTNLTTNFTFAHNAVLTPSTSGVSGSHLTDNWYKTAWTAGDVMVNQASGNYNIVNPSTYWTNASPGDGVPIGADFYTSSTDVTSVYTMTEDCVSGNWDAKDIVLYAKDATTKTSHWTVTSNALAAGEAYLGESDTGGSQSTALASPTSYFELTFPAVANKPYRLMIRGKANGNSLNSDSVFVQFTNTLASLGGAASYRIGTTSAMEWRLQNGSSDTISNWGWRDTEIAGVTAEKQVIFATTGTQTIRVQRKEDGVHIDQILLSPSTYLGRGPVDANPEVNPAWDSPGYEDNDTSIVIKTHTPTGGSPAGEIVLWASEAGTRVGTWAVTADATAAGGSRIGQPNAGQAKIDPALASPTNYFEITFQAQANTPYHIWVRGKALNNDWANDSAYMQFNNSIASVGGAATWRIGTTSAAPIFLEEGSGAGVAEWGWNDNSYDASGVLGANVVFATSGTQTMRVQQREDGYQIDQIVLSPATYLTTRPGALKNDTTILPKTGSSPVTIVLHAKNAPTKVGTWATTVDATAAGGSRIGQPNAGQAKIDPALASPANYFEMTFFAHANTPYHIWFRGKALNNDWNNDSAYAQFNNSIAAVGGAATWRIGTTSATPIFLEEGSGVGVAEWGWNDNSYDAGGTLGADVIFNTTGMQTIRVQQREDGYQIDQIVLSPTTYLATRPGATKNDTLILPEQQ